MVSYLTQVPGIVGSTFGQMIGDPSLLGFFALFLMFILWAYAGAGFEVGVIVFSPFIIMLSMYGFLPIWVNFLVAVAVAVLLAKVFGGVFR